MEAQSQRHRDKSSGRVRGPAVRKAAHLPSAFRLSALGNDAQPQLTQEKWFRSNSGRRSARTRDRSRQEYQKSKALPTLSSKQIGQAKLAEPSGVRRTSSEGSNQTRPNYPV